MEYYNRSSVMERAPHPTEQNYNIYRCSYPIGLKRNDHSSLASVLLRPYDFEPTSRRNLLLGVGFSWCVFLPRWRRSNGMSDA